METIFTNAGIAGVLNTTSSVINMIFVDGINALGGSVFNENQSTGFARVGSSGVLQYVGDNLLTFENGRDVIASVVAHEIGHNLGLEHPNPGLANLMSPSGTSEQLTSDQISAIFQTTARNDSVAFIPDGGTGLLTPVPEPASLAIIMGSTCLLFAAFCRRAKYANLIRSS